MSMRSLPPFDLQPIREALQTDDLPVLPRTDVGRIRLVRALSNRFGAGFRAVPAAQRALEYFDNERDMAREIIRMRKIRDGKR